MTGKKRESLQGYLFILPVVILFAVFIIYPIVYNIHISFYDWNGINLEKTFIGVKNYTELFHDPIMKKTVINFIKIALLTTVIQAFFGLIFASFFIRRIPLSKFYRIMFYLPVIATPTIVGNMFSKIFEANRGYLNGFLRSIGLGALCRGWLASSKTALGCLIFVNIWQWTGYSMLMYYAGMLTIPEEIYESAALDGAGPVQRFCYITFPMLRETHYTLFILGVLGALKFFDLSYVLTSGGPAHATETFSTYLFTQSFNLFNQGKASAIAVIMLFIAMIITFIQFKLYIKKDKETK